MDKKDYELRIDLGKRTRNDAEFYQEMLAEAIKKALPNEELEALLVEGVTVELIERTPYSMKEDA